MTSSNARAMLGAATAAVTGVAVAGFGGLPLALGVLSAGTAAALASVVFSTQSRRLRDEERLVYRPVHARRQSVRRRVGSDD